MLPRATSERTRREGSPASRAGAPSMIQRLTTQLRVILDLQALGERQIRSIAT